MLRRARAPRRAPRAPARAATWSNHGGWCRLPCADQEQDRHPAVPTERAVLFHTISIESVMYYLKVGAFCFGA